MVVVVGGTVVVVVGGTVVVVVGGTVVVVVVAVAVVVVVVTLLAGELVHPARRTARAMVAMTTPRVVRKEDADAKSPAFMRGSISEP
jgi:hypothetical protein